MYTLGQQIPINITEEHIKQGIENRGNGQPYTNHCICAVAIKEQLNTNFSFVAQTWGCFKSGGKMIEFNLSSELIEVSKYSCKWDDKRKYQDHKLRPVQSFITVSNIEDI